MNVGFIGTGQLGSRMAERLLDGGYDLVVHDIRREAATRLLEKGATWADTPREVALACRVVISSLPAPQDVEQVVFGTDGLKDGWREGDIYVDTSTSSPATIRRIAEYAKAMDVAVLDAPISGGTIGAEQGNLVFMVGGGLGALEKVEKILRTLGRHVFPVGDVGCGTIAKLINNMISLTTGVVTSEGFVLGVKAGLDPQTLYEVITVSTGNSWNLQQYPQTILAGNFEPGFRLSLAAKDMRLAMELAKDHGVPVPVGAAAEQALIEAKAAGLGDKHITAEILRLEDLVGVQVRSQKR